MNTRPKTINEAELACRDGVQRGKRFYLMAYVLEASRLELVLASAAVTLGHKVHDTVALCRPEHKCAGHALVWVTKVTRKLSF